MYRPSLVAGAISGAVAVIFGAFGAHGLESLVRNTAASIVAKGQTPEHVLEIYGKGVTYQFYHTLALLITGILYSAFPSKALRAAHAFFILGILCFSGSLYGMTAMIVHGDGIQKWIGPVTPAGGAFFIGGWICLLAGILKKK